MGGAPGERKLVWALQFLVLFLAFAFFLGLSRAFSFFPHPASVLQAALQLFASGEIYAHLLVTLYETLAGLAAGIALGIGIGFALGVSRTAAEIFEPMILAAYAVPKIVFLPLLLMIFGVGLASKVANAALHAVFPVLLNTVVGMREVNPVLVKLARSMNASTGQMFRKIYFPSMVLPVFAGMRIGLGFGFLGALLAELFEAKAGLGYLVADYYNSGRIAEMLAVILFVFVLTMSLNAALQAVERRLSRWRGASWN